MPRNLASTWRRLPSPVRKTLVATIGATLVALGVALIVLPGPFTLPLLIAGFAVLGTEFAWAARALAKTRSGLDTSTRIARSAGARAVNTVRRPKT